MVESLTSKTSKYEKFPVLFCRRVTSNRRVLDLSFIGLKGTRYEYKAQQRI